MQRSLRLLLATAPLLATVLTSPRAQAQSDKAGAEALLNEGVKLSAAHDYAAACPKFEESLRLYASLNTEYFLADCYEHAGRTASAWIDYLEVAEKARASGETSKETRARDRAGKIEAMVSHLTIQVSDSAPSDLTIERDGVSVGRAQWGVAMPVDPGERTVVASAAGRVAVTLHVTVKSGGARETVTVPMLEPDAQAQRTQRPAGPVTPSGSAADASGEAPPALPPPATGHGQRVAGVVVAATGVVALALGEVLAAAANASYKGAPGCTGDVCESQSSVDTRNSARSLGTVGTVMVIAGAAVAVGGAVLWLTAPSGSASSGSAPSHSASALVPRDWRVGVTPGALVLRGRF